jgi:hypothetical protein
VAGFFANIETIDHLVETSHASSVVTGAIASLADRTVAAARAFMEWWQSGQHAALFLSCLACGKGVASFGHDRAARNKRKTRLRRRCVWRRCVWRRAGPSVESSRASLCSWLSRFLVFSFSRFLAF